MCYDQGSSAFARVGGSARLVGVVGLGKASKLEAVPSWSVSPFQVLCCAVLCCAVLCCAVLCCAVLCCAVLCCAVLC